MRRWRRRPSAARLAVLAILGAPAIGGAWWIRQQAGRRRRPAPAAAQAEGLRAVERVLAQVNASPFGRSPRGQRLTQTLRELLRRDRVAFTADLTTQALFRQEPDGDATLFVRVLRLGGRFVHQPDELIAEGLYHEAVHARRADAAQSQDEECDAFAAGLAAGAAVAGRMLPDVLTIEGRTVAEFVAWAYPELPRRPGYRPVGESREWLERRTGLH